MTPRRFAIAGHRGAMALEPENTIASFLTAAQMGVDELELDVHLSRDGEIVVMHDETVDRTTNGTGRVDELDWSDLQELRVSGEHRIPRLADVFEAVADIPIQVEVKAPAAVRAVLAMLEMRPEWRSRAMILSFHQDVIAAVPIDQSGMKRGIVVHATATDPFADARKLDVDFLFVHAAFKDSPEAATYIEEGREIGVWPIETSEEVAEVIALGFTRVTSNDPRIAMAARKAAGIS